MSIIEDPPLMNNFEPDSTSIFAFLRRAFDKQGLTTGDSDISRIKPISENSPYRIKLDQARQSRRRIIPIIDIASSSEPERITQLDFLSREKTKRREFSLRTEKKRKKVESDEESVSSCKKNVTNLCKICFTLPRDAVFQHDNTGHEYSCYQCAMKVWKDTEYCPICRKKISNVIKVFK